VDNDETVKSTTDGERDALQLRFAGKWEGGRVELGPGLLSTRSRNVVVGF
jgi:hypothetical protein